MKRWLFTIDEETVSCLKRWRAKGVPASEAVRMAVKAYTTWKKSELQPKPEEFEGVDNTVEYD